MPTTYIPVRFGYQLSDKRCGYFDDNNYLWMEMSTKPSYVVQYKEHLMKTGLRGYFEPTDDKGNRQVRLI